MIPCVTTPHTCTHSCTHITSPTSFPSLKHFFEGGRFRPGKPEAKTRRENGGKEGRKDIWTDGTNRWTIGMDRWMEQRDGQTGWEYGRNQMDRKDEEGTDQFFLSLSSLSYLIFLSPLHSDSDQNSTPYLTFTYFYFYCYFFKLASSNHSLACSSGGGCYRYGYPSDTSATLYLIPLFTIIYLQTFTLLPLPQYQYLAIPQ
jgi:hypothetical protein